MDNLGVKLNYSTAYHPQTDGQTERVNQCLENFLRCMVFDKQNKWNQWLYLAEHWYNSSFHTALKSTPFQALYGYEPRGLPCLSSGKGEGTDKEGQNRQQTLQMLKENLEKAQNRMKKYADKHKSERQFKVGDWVYLKLQPYRQISVSGQIHSKLNPKYYGPYEVLERVGPLAYKLNLPVGSSIHPVIHVSQLKLKKGTGSSLTTRLPVVGPDGELRIEPIRIMDRRVVKRHNTPTTQLLIQWFNRSEEAATWEDYEKIAENYPNFILEDKNYFKGGELSGLNGEFSVSENSAGLGAVGRFETVKETDGVNNLSVSGAADGSRRLMGDGVTSVNEGVSRSGVNTCPRGP